MAYVYRHIRLDKNEVFYVGIGSDQDYKRAYLKKARNAHWIRVVNKVDYEVEIVFDNLTWVEACEKEREFIKLYGRKDLELGTLVNMTDGGEGLLNPSKEVRAKLHRVATEETKAKLRAFRLGSKCTKETKEKMSKAQKGRPKSEQHRLALRKPKPTVKRTQCPECGKIGHAAMMSRWHFNNCKHLKN